jgi:hypothetical protein
LSVAHNLAALILRELIPGPRIMVSILPVAERFEEMVRVR